jgi:hypothetical protein
MMILILTMLPCLLRFAHTVQHVSYYMQGLNTNANGRPSTLEEALTIYESFHVLEAHEVQWSKEHAITTCTSNVCPACTVLWLGRRAIHASRFRPDMDRILCSNAESVVAGQQRPGGRGKGS